MHRNQQETVKEKSIILYSTGEHRPSDCQIRRVVEIRESAPRNSNFPVLLRRDRHRRSACQILGGAWKVDVSKCEPRKSHRHVELVWNSSQRPSGTEAGTCVHCKTKQCVEAEDEHVYSSGSTQTPGEDAESEEVVSSSSSSSSSSTSSSPRPAWQGTTRLQRLQRASRGHRVSATCGASRPPPATSAPWKPD